MTKKKAFLVILDGWGIAKDPSRSAIDLANTPFIDSLKDKYPHSTLVTYGSKVGLPDGQMGNSEVGHLNIGAGRIVYQDFARINKEIEDKAFAKNENLVALLSKAASEKKKVHFMGLLSDGGVHSHIDHLKALCNTSQSYDLPKVCIHAFMDGRDCDPQSGKGHLENILNHIEPMPNVYLSTLIGRYYAMDRDNRWERIKKAYDLLVHGKAEFTSEDIISEISKFYDQDITDEFIPSVLVDSDSKIEEGDVVLFFNFRTDRPRQLTSVLTQEDIPDFDMAKLNISMFTMTEYDENFKNVQPLYRKDNLKNTLGEVLQDAGKTQVRVAETEKYPHVTFFFSGGREQAFKNETRLLVNSPKVDTYDLAPEMGAIEITDKVLKEVSDNHPDFICLNYANADMVGHTGILSAAITACETLDLEVKRLVEKVKDEYEIIIIADHGNSDIILNTDGSPHTAHTTNPVPIYLLSEEYKTIKTGKLGDIAVTILDLMDIDKPEEMTGNSLLN